MKQKILLALVVLFAMQTLCWAESKSTISFSWALLYCNKGGTISSMDVAKNLSVYSGDSLRIMIKPKDAYVYLFYQDSSGDLSLIYPIPVYNHKIGTLSYVPSEKEWYEFDRNKGTETLYLLASKKRLLDLEQITKKYLDAQAKDKGDLESSVLAEIKNIRKANSSFTTSAEKSVSVIGSFRGKPSSEVLATEITAESFYGKTIRIEHK